jgi:hypothetical protein
MNIGRRSMDATLECAAAVRRPPLWRRPLYRAAWKAQRAACSHLFLDVGGDHRSTLYIAGGARSGTTWLAEFLNYRNEYRFIQEPLSPPPIGAPAFRHFVRGQYLRPDDVRTEYREPVTALLSGRMRHHSIDHFNRRPVSRRRLIKDIYANLLLKWLGSNYPGMPIVFLIRHPMAVITSRLARADSDPHGFDPDLGRFLTQDDLMEDFLAPFHGAVEDASTALDQHAFSWCIENYVPLQMLSGGEFHAVCYESLRTRADEEIPRLGTFIGHDFAPVVFKRMARHSLTGPHSALRPGADPVTNWTHRWSRNDVRRVVRILSLFGLDLIYNDNPMPRTQGIVDFQSSRASRPLSDARAAPAPTS